MNNHVLDAAATGSEDIDFMLQHEFDQFPKFSKQNLTLFNIQFNRATMQHLINVLICKEVDGEGGLKNSLGQPVLQLDLGGPGCNAWERRYTRGRSRCPLDEAEVISLLQDFFETNKSPKTLETIVFHRSYMPERDYKRLLSSFHRNKTVKKLSFRQDHTIRYNTGGAMVGDLLRQNTTLTCLEMVFCPVNNGFIGAMREGLLASRSRLQSLRMEHANIGKQELNELRLIYESTGHEKTVLSELSLRNNDIHGAAGGNDMRRLLLTLPCLKKLEISCHLPQDGVEFASALFADAGMAAVLGRLQTLNMADCWIGNRGLAQMVASIPDNASIVDLNLSYNLIQGHAGGQSLGRLLRCCRCLETLGLSHNHAFGPAGARALAPSLGNLRFLQKLSLYNCHIAHDGATAILTSLTTTRPYLKSLNLEYNDLPSTTLPMLTEFLNTTGGSCLEDLQVGYNGCLFEQTTNCDQQAPCFFAALASHNHIEHLGVSRCGMNTLTEGLLLNTLVQNTALVCVEHSIDRLKAITEEYMRRNKMLSKMKMTMSKPIGTPLAVWPVALECCSQQKRIHLAGRPTTPAFHFWLVQKMMEANVFPHTAAVYRFEKVRACTRIQQWWRQPQQRHHLAKNEALATTRWQRREHFRLNRKRMARTCTRIQQWWRQRRQQHHLAQQEAAAAYLFARVRACTQIQQWWHEQQQEQRLQAYYSMLEEVRWLDSRRRAADDRAADDRVWIIGVLTLILLIVIVLLLLLLILLIVSSSFTTSHRKQCW